MRSESHVEGGAIGKTKKWNKRSRDGSRNKPAEENGAQQLNGGGASRVEPCRRHCRTHRPRGRDRAKSTRPSRANGKERGEYGRMKWQLCSKKK
eukprot:9482306-Pyramimonas_sp.AAC.1